MRREPAATVTLRLDPLDAPPPKRWWPHALVMALLFVLLAIVLTPLFWMILTAFKTRGTAFQMAFLPERHLWIPPREARPYTLPVAEPGGRYLHVEIRRPDIAEAQLAITLPDGRKETAPMRFFGGGLWAVTAGPLPEGELQGELFLNGEAAPLPGKETAPAALRLQEGVTRLPEKTEALFYRSGKEIIVEAAWPSGHGFALLSGDGQPVFRMEVKPESPEVDGAAAGERRDRSWLKTRIPVSREIREFRLRDTRPLGEAIRARYSLENFRVILTSKDFNFGVYFLNSLVVATSAGLFTVLLCSLAAFAFGYFRFHFREALFLLLLSSMLVPGMIYMVPQFSITLKMGLMNTYAGMVIPHLANVFGLFLLRQYILQIPRDLFAAAEIDGASDLQIFRTIVIPVCLPIMVTLFLVVFVSQWSNFLWQLIINTGDSRVLTLPVGLQQFKGQNANEWERIMAGACFSILPISILFLSLQKHFLEGLTAGAVKE